MRQLLVDYPQRYNRRMRQLLVDCLSESYHGNWNEATSRGLTVNLIMELIRQFLVDVCWDLIMERMKQLLIGWSESYHGMRQLFVYCLLESNHGMKQLLLDRLLRSHHGIRQLLVDCRRMRQLFVDGLQIVRFSENNLVGWKGYAIVRMENHGN